MKLYVTFLLVNALIAPSFVVAEFRCQTTGKIVSEGMSQSDVVANCGEPSGRSTLTSPQNQVVTIVGNNSGKPTDPKANGTAENNTTVQVTQLPQIEEWTYDFGSSYLTRKLRFEGGILKSDESGSYGTAKK